MLQPQLRRREGYRKEVSAGLEHPLAFFNSLGDEIERVWTADDAINGRLVNHNVEELIFVGHVLDVHGGPGHIWPQFCVPFLHLLDDDT